MGSAFHQLCPRYRGTLTPTAPTAIRLWEIFTFIMTFKARSIIYSEQAQFGQAILCDDSSCFSYVIKHIVEILCTSKMHALSTCTS